jgi:hypothetical protein
LVIRSLAKQLKRWRVFMKDERWRERRGKASGEGMIEPITIRIPPTQCSRRWEATLLWAAGAIGAELHEIEAEHMGLACGEL